MRKLLFLCTRLPYPPMGGGNVKNYQLIRGLSTSYQLTLVVISADPLTAEARSFLESHGELHFFHKTPAQFLGNATLAALRLPDPLQVSLYNFANIRKAVTTLASGHDAVLANLVRTAKYAEHLEIPKICDISDSIGLNYRSSAKKVRSLFHRVYYRMESELLLHYEQQVIERFDRCTFFNRSEMEYFRRPEKTSWVPFGVEERLLSYEQKEAGYKNGIAFFGKMNYRPNIDAARWLVEKVLPLLSPEIRIYIVGANPTREVCALSGPRVEVTGFVEDPYLILKSVSAVVSPMQIGGGIQSKVLEAMALGQVNVVTPLAASALPEAERQEALLVAESEATIAALINELFKRPDSFHYVGHNARKFIRHHHTWAHCTRAFSDIIDEVIEVQAQQQRKKNLPSRPETCLPSKTTTS